MPLSHPPSIQISQITENIYLGTAMCCENHKDFYAEKMKEHNIFADIDLRLETGEPTPQTQAHTHLPVQDTFPPTLEQTKLGVEIIDQVVKMGKRVYVHCQVGHGRSPTLVIAYFILKEGMQIQEAVDFVKSKRHEVHPTEKQLEFLHSLK